MIVVWFALAMLLMLAGVIGSLLPLVPGLALVLVGVYVYALGTGLAAGVGLEHLVLYTIVGGAAIVASSMAAPFATRKAGGSRAGVIGATISLIVGLASRAPCPQPVARGCRVSTRARFARSTPRLQPGRRPPAMAAATRAAPRARALSGSSRELADSPDVRRIYFGGAAA
jgi:Protein of unknown function (DUF456)